MLRWICLVANQDVRINCLLRPEYDSQFAERLRTFNTYVDRPHASREIASNLALAGFVYLPEDSRILCELCGLELSAEFPERFDPEALHRGYGANICPRYTGGTTTAGTKIFLVSYNKYSKIFWLHVICNMCPLVWWTISYIRLWFLAGFVESGPGTSSSAPSGSQQRDVLPEYTSIARQR